MTKRELALPAAAVSAALLVNRRSENRDLFLAKMLLRKTGVIDSLKRATEDHNKAVQRLVLGHRTLVRQMDALTEIYGTVWQAVQVWDNENVKKDDLPKLVDEILARREAETS